MSFIYSITNSINGNKYIGSTININKRWYVHKYNLNKNQHINNHLQNAWNKYGKNNFKFEVVEECSDGLLLDNEQKWIDYYKKIDKIKLYNIADYTSMPMLGKKHSEESLKKIGKASSEWHRSNKGTLKYENYISNLSKSLSGHKLNEETKIKIGRANKGKLLGDKNPFYGKYHTKESRLKIAKTHAKLTDLDVKEIITLLNNGVKVTYLANIFNISRSTILNIREGSAYKHIDRNSLVILRQNTLHKLETLNKYKEIKKQNLNVVDAYKIKVLLFKYKIKCKEIAKIYNTHGKKISRIKKGEILSWIRISDSLNVDNELMLIKNNNGGYFKKKVICLTTGEIFGYIRDASEKYKINSSNISTTCGGKAKSAGKHPITGEKLIWMYYDEYIKTK